MAHKPCLRGVAFERTALSSFALTGHEYLVLVVLVRVREDVGTLESLREEPKDIVDDQQCGLSILGTGGVCLHAVDGDPFALFFVALAHDRRDGAASLGLCRHGCKSPGALYLGWMFETCFESVVCGDGSGEEGLGEEGLGELGGEDG